MVSFSGSLRRVFYFYLFFKWLDALCRSCVWLHARLDMSCAAWYRPLLGRVVRNHNHCLEWLQSAPPLSDLVAAGTPSGISELYLLSFWCIYSASSMNISLGPVEHLQSLLANHLCVAAWILSVLLWVGTPPPPQCFLDFPIPLCPFSHVLPVSDHCIS